MSDRQALNLVKWLTLGCIGFGIFQNATVRGEDRLYPAQGNVVRGTIKEMTRDRVVIDNNGRTQNFATQDISRIVFEGEPQSLTRAKELVANKQMEQAVSEIKKVDPASISSENAKKEYDYYLWSIEGRMALAGSGDANASVKGLLAYAKDNPQSFHFYEMTELLGQLAVSLGNFDRAAAYFAALAKAPAKDVQLRGRFMEAKALLIQDKFDEAKGAFSQVLAASSDSAGIARIQKLAQVGLARVELGLGNADAALEVLYKMVREGDAADGELFAAIYNAQGACLMAKEEFDGAVLAFLHTDLLYPGQADSHAEALYHLASLWTKLGEPQRAVDAKSRLNSLYAGSVWAKK